MRSKVHNSPVNPWAPASSSRGLLDGGELGLGQPGDRAAGAPAVQGGGAALGPAGMPDADGLGRDLELAGDLGLTHADGEQLGRAQPAGLEPLAFSLCRRAARDGWHPRILTCQQSAANSGIPQPDTQDPLGRLRPQPPKLCGRVTSISAQRGCSGIHSAFAGGSTSNGSGLSTGPAAVTTVITPLVAPSGTTARTSVSETRLTFVAATFLNMTA